MAEIFSISGLFTLAMLVLLQAVLGFDNLLYISIESKRVAEDQQAKVRRLGIGLAIVLRIVLLAVVIGAIKSFEKPFFEIHIAKIFDGEFTLECIVTLFGGVFIIYTATKEIMHMLAVEHIDGEKKSPRSFGMALFWIILMNLVFSFDSILSAMALTKNFWIMATAIVISGLMMIYLADTVSEFLKKNRLYEVLGLFILFIVGVMLISEGGHKGHLAFFGHEIHAMAKSTFYFVIAVLVIVDVIQSRYQKKLMAQKQHEVETASHGG